MFIILNKTLDFLFLRVLFSYVDYKNRDKYCITKFLVSNESQTDQRNNSLMYPCEYYNVMYKIIIESNISVLVEFCKLFTKLRLILCYSDENNFFQLK